MTPDAGTMICDNGRPLWPERWSFFRHETYWIRVTAITSGPAPLCIDGHAYRRRQAARRRRRRGR